jgi:hypothetical protein
MAKSKEVATHDESYGLSAIDRKELGSIEVEMHTLHVATEKTLKGAFIKFGDMLCEARTLIADDIKFGEWRQACTPFDSKQNANAAMQLSRAISDNTITTKMLKSNMGQSHLVELTRAPLTVQAEIETMIADGKTPTIKEIRALKKVAEDRLAGKTSPDVSTSKKNPDGQEQTGNFKDGYEIKADEKVINPKEEKPTPKRSVPDLVLDLVNESEQAMGDVLGTTVEIHKFLEHLKDKDGKDMVNEARVAIKEAQAKMEALFDHIETKHF